MFAMQGWAIAPVLSEYSLITWGSQAHTAEPVTLTAIGAKSSLFGGYKDNTDVAQAMAKAMGVELN